jgi:hypothetical protein
MVVSATKKGGMSIPNDEYEPNDDYDQATDIGYQSYSAIAAGDERDIYKFDASEGDVVTVNVSYDKDVTQTPDLDVRTASGSPVGNEKIIAPPTAETETQQAVFTADSTGTYYIVVEGEFDSETAVDYQLSLKRNTNDRYEPNTGFDSAVPIENGQYTNLTAYWTETDVYKFDASEGDVVTVNVSYDKDVTQTPDLDVRTASGSPVGNQKTVAPPTAETETQQAVFTADSTGTYYIVVEGEFDSETAVDYQLSLKRNTNDRYEPNTGFDSAVPIENGQYTNLTAYWTETDVYKFDASEGDVVTVNVSYDKDVTQTPDLDVRTASDSPVGNEKIIAPPTAETETQQAVFTADSTGTYYIVVEGEFDSESSVRYVLKVEGASTGTPSPPVADAGEDKSVSEETTVDLDATGSSDPDGDTLSYTWEQTAGPNVSLTDADTVTPTFTAPDVDSETDLVFEVTVDDGSATDTDTTTVTVTPSNAPPTADAGDDQTVSGGDTVTLDANGSSDPNGDTLTYSWTQTAGPTISLSDADTATPTFTAPNVDTDTTLTFKLTVDNGSATATDTTTVTVTANSSPLTVKTIGVTNENAQSSAASIPAGEVVQGETVEFTATVTNTGSSTASDSITLSFGSVVSETISVSNLAAGAQIEVYAKVRLGTLSPGDYTLSAGAGGTSTQTTVTVRKLGDANHDGSVGPGDATKAQKRIVGIDPSGNYNPAAADTKPDNSIGPGDVTRIQKIIVGLFSPDKDLNLDTTVKATGTR